MKMKMIRSVVLVFVEVSLGVVAVACGQYSSPDDTGGNAGSGGTGGTVDAGGTGGTVDAGGTGGNVVGTWNATSSCLNVTGQMDMTGSGLGCSSASVTGSLQVTGTWTLNSDGTYSDNTTTSGDEEVTLPAECLKVSGTTTTCDRVSGSLKSILGYATLSCITAARGGCTCSATVQQTGGMGLVSSSASASGTYTTLGNVVTTSAGGYSYYVSGNTMTMTPQSTSKTVTVTGTVVLQSGSDRGGTPCGGNLVGSWTATSSCLNVTGQMDMTGFGLGCSSASVAGSLQVTGTWTANSDGTYSDNTTTSGDEHLELPAECLKVSGTTTTCDRVGGPLKALGYASVSCTSAAGGGGTDGGTGGTGGAAGDGGPIGDGGGAPGGCTCPATVQQTGGMGVVSSSASASGTYAIADNKVTTSGGMYSYCVSGNTMTMTPQSTTTTGTIVLQKQ